MTITKNFHFQALPLSKVLVALLITIVVKTLHFFTWKSFRTVVSFTGQNSEIQLFQQCFYDIGSASWALVSWASWAVENVKISEFQLKLRLKVSAQSHNAQLLLA